MRWLMIFQENDLWTHDSICILKVGKYEGKYFILFIITEWRPETFFLGVDVENF